MNFLFKAKKGKPTFVSEYARLRFLDHLDKHEGKLYRIDLVQNTRSLSQNSLLWLFYTEIGSYTGYTPEEVHEVMKQRHLPKEKIIMNGGEYQVIKSTSRLKKGEMIEYMMKVEKDGLEMGLKMPNPREWEMS